MHYFLLYQCINFFYYLVFRPESIRTALLIALNSHQRKFILFFLYSFQGKGFQTSRDIYYILFWISMCFKTLRNKVINDRRNEKTFNFNNTRRNKTVQSGLESAWHEHLKKVFRSFLTYFYDKENKYATINYK